MNKDNNIIIKEKEINKIKEENSKDKFTKIKMHAAK